MPSRIALASEYQPDFGVPYPRDWRRRFDLLANEQIVQLSEAKVAIDLGKPVDLAGMDPEVRLQATRLIAEKNADDDPMQFGWTLESWREVLAEWKTYQTHFVLGGRRSSKSALGSRLVVWVLQNIPEARVRCYQVNDEKSIVEQQSYIWAAIPKRYKELRKKRSDVHDISYSQKNGFTGGKLIFPPLPGCERGGECIFGTYAQFRNDPLVVEGFWAHLVWADEELDVKMFERLLYRIKDANGRMLNTFTTTNGWTPLVEDVMGKTRTLRKRFAPLLKKELPVAQESIRRNSTRLHFFWTEDNPFLPAGHMDSYKGRPEAEIKAAAYGIPSKSASSIFTIFDEAAHVVRHADLPFLKVPAEGEPDQRPPVTWYHIIDPAGDKPWFMLWCAVDAKGAIYVVEEWPDQSYGAWGEASASPEGARGPAQRSQDFDITDYIETMKFIEEKYDCTPYERLIDPRLGNTKTLTLNGATTYQSVLEDGGIVTVCAPGNVIHHGLDLIKQAMKFDPDRPVSLTNCPKLRISDNCQNLIEAIKSYTNFSFEEVWKDPIDCLRYLLESGADHVSLVHNPNHETTQSYGASE